jgi:hypothetical protein
MGDDGEKYTYNPDVVNFRVDGNGIPLRRGGSLPRTLTYYARLQPLQQIILSYQMRRRIVFESHTPACW